MGGKLRDGYCVIGGVVKRETREFFDELVRQKMFDSRSDAVGRVLSDFEKNFKADD